MSSGSGERYGPGFSIKLRRTKRKKDM
eukprot:COSAG06_NODE_35220_length_462_cov_7.680441_2_plen_26_part_01